MTVVKVRARVKEIHLDLANKMTETQRKKIQNTHPSFGNGIISFKIQKIINCPDNLTQILMVIPRLDRFG
jgi:hypothetical protein